MRRLIRAPLTWMIVAECAVVSVLILVAWHVIASATTQAPPVPFSFPAAEASPADTALPALGMPVVGANTRRPLPGLNVGIDFWRQRLRSLNRDEAAFEALEWRITHTVMDTARDYLETVVLPSIRHAEGGSA